MNVLMVMWDSGGNVPPFLGLGRELVHRGHRVRCLGPLGLEKAVTRLGIEFCVLQDGAVFDPLAPLSMQQSQQATVPVFLGEGYMADVRSEVEREQPDILLVDCFLMSSQAAAELSGVPFAILVHALPGWFLPFWDEFLLPRTNAMRERFGLSVVSSTSELWNLANLTLVASTPLLDTVSVDPSVIQNLRYVGPIFEPVVDGDPSAFVFDTTQPLILVSFSTTAMEQGEDLLSRTVETLQGLPVRAVVTTGPAMNAAKVTPGPNVSVHRWIPHTSVLPHSSLFVTHAGHSSIVKSLAYGIPLLCFPLGRDQGFNARRVQELGAGISMPPDAASPAVADAITAILEDSSYRLAAEHVSEMMRSGGAGESNAANDLEVIGLGRA